MAGKSDDRIEGDLPVVSAETAAAHIPAEGTLLTSGFGSVGYPKAVPLALAESDRDRSLTLISGGSVGGEIDTELVTAGVVTRRFPYQATSEARERANDGRLAFHDRHIAGLSDEIAFEFLADADIAVVEAVAVGEDWLVPSTSLGHTPACVEAAEKLVVELNRAQPLALQKLHDTYRPDAPPDREPIPLTDPDERIGDARVRFDPGKLIAVVETDRRDSPYSFREPTEVDRAIAANLGEFLTAEMDDNPALAETVRLQFGVGSLGNALMSELERIPFGDRDVAYYGEVIQDGLLDLLDEGQFSAASATSLALSTDGQDRLFGAVDRYAEDVVLRPADVSNSPELINRLGVVAVNSALEVDLYSHVNSTHVDGSHVINGLGGSGDFNRNALLSITVLPSTTRDGDLSRIVPMVPHADHTEHDVDVVITERGVADLRGLVPRERAGRLIDNCAHPAFREQLQAYYDQAREQGGHIPHDLDTAFDWQ
jgi:succinyl-CoA:acetate CoA-transferase